MKANPLGELEMEIVHNASADISAGESEARFRNQVPVHDSLSGADTYKVDAQKPSSRAPVELRRAHLEGGQDLKGASMRKEFGKGDKGDVSTEDSAA